MKKNHQNIGDLKKIELNSLLLELSPQASSLVRCESSVLRKGSLSFH